MFPFAARLHTIVVVTVDTVARVDLLDSSTPQVIDAWRVDRSAQSSLADAIHTAFALGPRKCGLVSVLSDEFWTGLVCLANEVVQAVAKEQLAQTLALEAEYESGLPPFDSSLGHVLVETVDQQCTYWITQAESSQIAAAEAAVLACRGKIDGFYSAFVSPRLPGDVNRALSPLETTDSCITLVQQWFVQIQAASPGIPVIRTVPGQLSKPQQWRYSGLLAAVAVLLCLAMHTWGDQRLADALAEQSQWIQRTEQIKTQIEQRDKALRLVREEHQRSAAAGASQRQKIEQLRREEAAYLAERKRPVQVLRALAATAQSSHWIRRIDWNEQAVVLSGLAVDNGAVIGLIEQLESHLTPSAWDVLPAKISGGGNTSLVEFEASLIPAKLPSAHVAATARGTAYGH